MEIISTEYELNAFAQRVIDGSTSDDLRCDGNIRNDVKTFFTDYEKANSHSAIAVLGTGLAIAAVIFTGGAALPLVAATAAGGIAAAAKTDLDRRTTRRMSLGEACYALAERGYRIKNIEQKNVMISKTGKW